MIDRVCVGRRLGNLMIKKHLFMQVHHHAQVYRSVGKFDPDPGCLRVFTGLLQSGKGVHTQAGDTVTQAVTWSPCEQPAESDSMTDEARQSN
jgi:hypothetical protein